MTLDELKARVEGSGGTVRVMTDKELGSWLSCQFKPANYKTACKLGGEFLDIPNALITIHQHSNSGSTNLAISIFEIEEDHNCRGCGQTLNTKAEWDQNYCVGCQMDAAEAGGER